MFIIVVFTVAAKLNFHIVRMLKCVLFKECIFGYNHKVLWLNESVFM